MSDPFTEPRAAGWPPYWLREHTEALLAQHNRLVEKALALQSRKPPKMAQNSLARTWHD